MILKLFQLAKHRLGFKLGTEAIKSMTNKFGNKIELFIVMATIKQLTIGCQKTKIDHSITNNP